MNHVPKFRSETTPDGMVVVRDVPVFAECEKAGVHFDAGWVDDAVRYQQAMEANNGATPIHIGHHGEVEPAKPAGAWFNTRAVNMLTKFGKTVRGAIADLWFTSAEAANRAKRGELLWRSCEIPLAAAKRESPPRFRSLALLDKHAPHVDDLPILSFANDKGSADVAWDRVVGSGAVLAFGSSDDAVCVLMEPDAMPEATATAEKPRVRMNGATGEVVRLEDEAPKADDAPKDDAPKSDAPEKKSGGIASIIERLKTAKMTIEDVSTLRTALDEIQAMLAGEGKGDTEDVMSETLGDPTANETAQTLSASDEVIALKADVIALKKTVEARSQADAKKAAVDKAEATLAGRGFSRDEILAFSDKPADIERIAVLLAAKTPVRDARFSAYMAQHAEKPMPDAVLKFSDGPDLEHATREWKRWERQDEGTKTRIPLATWLDIHPRTTPHFDRGTEA